MKCEKFSKQELGEWGATFDTPYEDSPLKPWLSAAAFEGLSEVFYQAASCSFSEMHYYIGAYSVEFAKYDDDARFRDMMKRIYQHAIACGDAGSCCNLANMYHNTKNQGSAEDYATAVELYELGSQRGDTQSSVNLGYIYYYGRGTAVDYRRAYECWSRVALVEDHPEALWKLGDLYAGGRGVPQSDWLAWSLYSKAYKAANGAAYGCRAAHHMADYLLKGIDGQLETDPDKALALYNEAELGYYQLIDEGLTYYQRQLDQAIEGQSRARAAVQEKHRRIRMGEMPGAEEDDDDSYGDWGGWDLSE